MNGTHSSRDRRWLKDPRDFQGSRRRRAGGHRRQRLDFDPLESRRLLSLSNPVAEFPLRTSGGTPLGGAVDGSGNIWVLLSNQNIVEDNSGGGTVAQYHIPTYNSLQGTPTGSELGLITYDAVDGDLWFYESNSNQFGSVNPTTGAITEYPAMAYAVDPLIMQITAGPDGNIWFTETNLNQVGMFDVTTGQISQFTMPVPDTQPRGITVGGDGNLWFTEGGLNSLGSLNPYTHVFNNYPYESSGYTQDDQAYGITAGPNDTIWFVLKQANEIVTFSTQTLTFTNRSGPVPPPNPPTPLPPANLFSIAEGPGGGIYYTEPTFNGIGAAGGDGGFYGALTIPGPPPLVEATPNVNGALLLPTTGADLWLTDPSDGNLRFVNGNTADGIEPAVPQGETPPTFLPPVIAATDANDVVSVGGTLYYTDTNDINGEIDAFNPATQLNTIYQLPEWPLPAGNPPNPLPPQQPNQMAVDDNGNIWFTETAVNAIGEFNPTTDGFDQVTLTSFSSNPTGLTWNSIEQLFWITEPGANQIVSYDPKTTGSAVRRS